MLTSHAFAGRHEEWVPRSKRLLSDGRSNVLVYMTGHGGDEFLKFQDQARVPYRYSCWFRQVSAGIGSVSAGTSPVLQVSSETWE